MAPKGKGVCKAGGPVVSCLVFALLSTTAILGCVAAPDEEIPGQEPVTDEQQAITAPYAIPQAYPFQGIVEMDDASRARVREAADGSTAGERLTELAIDDNRYVRLAVAGNPSAPNEALRLLYADSDLDIRVAVAENPVTPRDVLEILLFDISTDLFGNYCVREAAARNLAHR